MLAKYDRTSPPGIKAASMHMRRASGIFEALSVASPRLPRTPSSDFRQAVLKMLSLAMLAQAQELFFEMGRVTGKVPPGSLARIEVHAADLFREAHSALAGGEGREIDREFPWTGYLRYKAATCDALACLQAFRAHKQTAEEEGRGYGPALGFARLAHAAARAAQDEVGRAKRGGRAAFGGARSEALVAETKTLLEEAEKENRAAYMEREPAASELPKIVPHPAAQPVPFPPLVGGAQGRLQTVVEDGEGAGVAGGGDGTWAPDGELWPEFKLGGSGGAGGGGGAGTLLLDGLMRPDVAAGVTAFQEATAEESRTWRAKVEDGRSRAQTQLRDLGLPGALEAAESERGIPDDLWGRVRRTQEAGGLEGLARQLGDAGRAADAARSALSAAEGAMHRDIVSYNAGLREFGSRWSDAVSHPDALWAAPLRELNTLRAYISSASASDARLRAALEGSRGPLARLGAPRSELEASVPAGGAGPSAAGSELRGEIRAGIVALARLLDARPGLVDSWNAAVPRARARTALETAAARAGGRLGEEERDSVLIALSGARDEHRAALERSFAQQEELLRSLSTKMRAFHEMRTADPATAARARALQEVSDAVDAFDRLRSGAGEAAEFWGNLRGAAEMLQREADDQATARELQQREMVAHLRGHVREGAPASDVSPASAPTPGDAVPPPSYGSVAGRSGSTPGLDALAAGGLYPELPSRAPAPEPSSPAPAPASAPTPAPAAPTAVSESTSDAPAGGIFSWFRPKGGAADGGGSTA